MSPCFQNFGSRPVIVVLSHPNLDSTNDSRFSRWFGSKTQDREAFDSLIWFLYLLRRPLLCFITMSAISWHTMCMSASGNTSLQCWHCVIEYNICASHNHVHHNQVGFTICHNLHLALSQQRECEGMHNRGGNDTPKGNDFHENTLHPFIKLLMSTKHNYQMRWQLAQQQQHTSTHDDIRQNSALWSVVAKCDGDDCGELENLASETTEDQPTGLENTFGDNKVSMVRKLAGMVYYLQ